jgi:hypothetical protein
MKGLNQICIPDRKIAVSSQKSMISGLSPPKKKTPEEVKLLKTRAGEELNSQKPRC